MWSVGWLGGSTKMDALMDNLFSNYFSGFGLGLVLWFGAFAFGSWFRVFVFVYWIPLAPVRL